MDSFSPKKNNPNNNNEYIELLEALFTYTSFGCMAIDSNGQILVCNNAYEIITGSKKEEIIGKNIKDLARKEGYDSASVQVLKTKKAVQTEQFLPNGKNYLVFANPYFNSNKEIKYVVCSLIDVTELVTIKQELREFKNANEKLSKELEHIKNEIYMNNNLIYRSASMKKVVDLALKVASYDATILITGDSGVGKELLANIIQANSNRKNEVYLKINCGAIPENLLESELFGYEPGAFTGAEKKGKKGIFEYANGGTILLDEIGDMPLNLQVKLLRVLQESEFCRIGGHEPIKIDARIIASTNSNLTKKIDEGTFRKDLFYRLNVIPIKIPPLEKRKEDIPILINFFKDKYNKKHHIDKKFNTSAIQQLINMKYEGNIRQLENTIERLMLIVDSNEIKLEHLSFLSNTHTDSFTNSNRIQNNETLKSMLEKKEKEILLKYFAEYKTTQKLAEVLGVNQSTISRKLAKYNIKY